MISKILFIVLFFISYSFAQANLDSLNCNLNVLLEFNNNLDSIDNALAIKFFKSFNDTCENNIEYSEWSIELLYKFLEKEPEKFLKVLSNGEEYNLKYIYKVLETPGYENIDLEEVYSKVLNVDLHNSVKEEILKRIQIAINKN